MSEIVQVGKKFSKILGTQFFKYVDPYARWHIKICRNLILK